MYNQFVCAIHSRFTSKSRISGNMQGRRNQKGQLDRAGKEKEEGQ